MTMPSHPPLLDQLAHELSERHTHARLRSLRPLQQSGPHVTCAGRTLLNLASNDYLALSTHPRLKQRVAQAAAQHGVGAGASRLVAGHLDLHQRLEQRFARFKHARACLLLPTGFMANLAVLSALAGRGDLICLDKLVHASLIDAAQATPATVRTFPHLQLHRLERLLQRHHTHYPHPPDSQKRPLRRFIVTDSVFSMDGDTADLPALCELAEQYNATLIVDEAHGTGVLGPDGAGLCHAQNVAHRVPIVISTASKALGSLGGLVTAHELVIQTLINHARALIYTTAAPPTQIAAIDAALDVIADETEPRQRLAELSRWMRRELTRLGWNLPQADPPTPILPLIVGPEQRALQLADFLQKHGFLAVAIRPPTVPPGAARVRLSLRTDLPDHELERLLCVLNTWN